MVGRTPVQRARQLMIEEIAPVALHNPQLTAKCKQTPEGNCGLCASSPEPAALFNLIPLSVTTVSPPPQKKKSCGKLICINQHAFLLYIFFWTCLTDCWAGKGCAYVSRSLTARSQTVNTERSSRKPNLWHPIIIGPRENPSAREAPDPGNHKLAPSFDPVIKPPSLFQRVICKNNYRPRFRTNSESEQNTIEKKAEL